MGIMMNNRLVCSLLCAVAIAMVVGKPPHIRDHSGKTNNGNFKRDSKVDHANLRDLGSMFAENINKRAEEYRYRRACNPMQCFQVLMAEVPEVEQMSSCNSVTRTLQCFQGCSDAQLY